MNIGATNDNLYGDCFTWWDTAPNMGKEWRMPTIDEFYELLGNCTWEWTTLNGFEGLKLQSEKPDYTDKSIFLPAAGYRDNYYVRLREQGSCCYYRTSNIEYDMPYTFEIENNKRSGSWSWGASYDNRYNGQSIRAVCP